jgi:hypothetical protein
VAYIQSNYNIGLPRTVNPWQLSADAHNVFRFIVRQAVRDQRQVEITGPI